MAKAKNRKAALPKRPTARKGSMPARSVGRDSLRQFAGSYRHQLHKTGDGYRIKLQRVDMVNGEGPYDYVLQVWVLQVGRAALPSCERNADQPSKVEKMKTGLHGRSR